VIQHKIKAIFVIQKNLSKIFLLEQYNY